MILEMAAFIMRLLVLLVEFSVVIDGMATSLRPLMAHRWPFHLLEYFRQEFTISKCHPPLVRADSKLLFTLLLESKGMFQAQISPGSIQLCRALIIGGFPTVTYPGCGCHHFHHRPPTVHNCTCQSAQMSPSPQC